MNPGIPADFLASEEVADPGNFRREYLAEFVAGYGAAIDGDLIRGAAIGEEAAARRRPDVRGVHRSGIREWRHRFACLIGHVEEDRIIVDRLASWAGTPRLSGQARLGHGRASRAVGRPTSGPRVTSDQFAAEPVKQSLEARGVRVEVKPWSNESKLASLTLLRRSLYQGRLLLPGTPASWAS